ncbi:four helix bundle protein [Flaviaesturariibacter amylovorans]|uniref:Four helix bundle protein n=1 Tax=Flaviaesturariibacter amylovorans TaxID=1084520 RepID=A0ABP8GED8_9BACT
MKNMTRELLEQRTKQFHIDVIRLCRNLPRDAAGYETAKQVIRSAGSVGANYRATRRAKSDDDFLYKMEVVLEEADESHYWLQVIYECGMDQSPETLRLIGEANELTAIFAAVCKTKSEKLEKRPKSARIKRPGKTPPPGKSEI